MTPCVLALAILAAGCGGGGDRASAPTVPRAASELSVSSRDVTDGGPIARVYSCDGAGREPVVRAGALPPGARELVLIVFDPDAPGGTFTHLTRYGRGLEGMNSAGKRGWTPPCPPKGDAPHRYVWSFYALRTASGLKAGAQPADVADAVKRAGVVAAGTLTARYGR
jgi:hypothetical protein